MHQLLETGYMLWPSVVPDDLRCRSIAELNIIPDEFGAWTTPLAVEFKGWLRAFLDSNNCILSDDSDLQIFNRYTGSIQPWHDDNDGSGRIRVFVCVYLTPTTEGRGPLKIIPMSHRNSGYESMRGEVLQQMYRQKNRLPPYENYSGKFEDDYPHLYQKHPDELIVEVPAGSVIAVNNKILHATNVHCGPERRTMVLWWRIL